MHNYSESWRKHIDKHTIDLRNAKKPQPAASHNDIDVSTQQTQDQVMRHFATMTPEEIEQTQVDITEKDIQEYSEALRRSLYEHKQQANASHTVHTANFSTDIEHTQNKAHNDIDRHSLLQELNTELASVEYNPPPPPPPAPQLQPAPPPPQPIQQFHPQPAPQQPPPPPLQPAPQPNPFLAQQSSELKNKALLADLPPVRSKKIDTKLSSFSYSPTVDGGEIVHALTTKAKKSVLKKTFIVVILLVLGAVLLGAGFLGGKFVNASEYAGEYAREGYQYMESGKDALLALDPATAHNNFQRAYQSFNNIEDSFGFFSRNALSLADLIPFQNTISSSARLLEAGKLYAQTGIDVSFALSQAQDLQDQEAILNSSERHGYTQSILQHFKSAQQKFVEANSIVATVHSDNIPAEFQQQFQTLQSQSSSIESTLNQIQKFLPATLDALGYTYEKRYLFMFQNHSELRATGGFVGTYGTVIVRNGQLEDLFINGIYDPDGQLEARVIPPKPLQYVTPNWGTRDANWFFDFPTSAQKTIRFFEMSGQGSVDGVIAITPHIVQELLRVVGDVEMPEYGIVVTADNFLEVVQQEVEVDYNKQLNKPKQILADLAPILIERVMEREDRIEIGKIFFDGLLNKNVMLYSTSPESQALFEEQGWGGAVDRKQLVVHNTINDYLAVAISNIGGGKTDVYTDSIIDSTTTIQNDGSIERTLWFSREHKGGNTPYSWYNKSNYGYVRFYVPLGSELIEASGFSEEPDYIFTDYIEQGYITDADLVRSESTLRKHNASNTDIFEESGKTVFGNWMLIRPGTKQLAYITYRIPATVSSDIKRYKFTMQKQSGVDIQHSDILKVEPNDVVLGDCALNGEHTPISKFTFIQTQDSVFACDITHR